MRLFTIFFALFFSTAFWVYTSPAYSATELTLYSTQQSAQQHYPNDEVVWLNTKTGIWHTQGARWYGNTKQGEYVCKKEAAATGNRGSLNG